MLNRFRECREKTSYSQKQVALILGVKPPQISKWESGKGGPSRENCIKLAKLYNVSADYLLGITDDPAPVAEQELIDAEATIRERLRRDPSYRLLFDAANKATPESLKAAAAVLKALEPKEDD